MVAPNTGVFTGTAAALGTVTGTLGRAIVFKYESTGSETLSITGTVKGSKVSSKIRCYDINTGALSASSDHTTGTYFIPVIYTDDLIFLGSGSSDTKTVTWLIGDHH